MPKGVFCIICEGEIRCRLPDGTKWGGKRTCSPTCSETARSMGLFKGRMGRNDNPLSLTANSMRAVNRASIIAPVDIMSPDYVAPGMELAKEASKHR